MLSADVGSIKRPENLAMLILSLVLITAFAFWMQRRERHGKPALIPNSMWKKRTFTSICLMLLLSYALVVGMELFSSLLYGSLSIRPRHESNKANSRSFQEVQGLSGLQTSIRFLPGVAVGVATRFIVGACINKVPAVYVVLLSAALCSVAPLLMALINPLWPFWYDAFFAQVCSTTPPSHPSLIHLTGLDAAIR